MWNRHLPLLSLVILLAGWEAVIWLFAVPDYILPAPHAILAALLHGLSFRLSSPAGLYINIAVTLVEALTSFVLGSAVGVVLGAVVVESRLARRILMPYVMALQSVPKVALAPLFIVWFGLGLSSKIVLGVLLTFFPLLINTATGLASVDRDRLELMTSMRASRWKTFRYVRLPSALPYIFAGLEMAAAYAILGAVVGEFVGGEQGLGVLILSRNAALDIPGAMAALVVLALMGVALQQAVVLSRRRLLFWAPSHDVLKMDEDQTS